MTGNPIRTYALVVCFSSLFAGAVSLVIGTYDLLQAAFPEQTNTAFQMQVAQAAHQQLILNTQIKAKGDQAEHQRPGEAIAMDRALARMSQPDHTYFVQSAIQSLILSTIVLVVSAGIFAFHWRLARGPKVE